MTERFPKVAPRAGIPGGVLLLIVAIADGWFQWVAFAQTGRFVQGYSTKTGYVFGSPLYALVPVFIALLGAWYLSESHLNRIEVTSFGISAYSFGRRKASLAWQDVKAFRRAGTRRVHKTKNSFKDVVVYRVEGDAGAVTFDETWPNLSRLIQTIRENLPSTAVNELPSPTADVLR